MRVGEAGGLHHIMTGKGPHHFNELRLSTSYMDEAVSFKNSNFALGTLEIGHSVQIYANTFPINS